MRLSNPWVILLLIVASTSANLAADPAATNAASPPPTFDFPDPTAKIEMLKRQPLATDSVFDGATFPKIDFFNQELVHAAAGAYSIHTRFFDAQWNEVTTPGAPGRYGALVEIKFDNGTTVKKNVTLYKTPKPYQWAKESYHDMMLFPSAFDVSDDVVKREKWNINNAQAATLGISEQVSDRTPALLGALQQLTADPARWHGFNVSYIEEAWWAALRKNLGENQDYPHLTSLPDGYDKDQKKWPLILFLHGSGERGANLDKVKDQGPLGYIHQGHPLPFVVITPQCPDDERWSSERLARLLDQVSASLRIDPRRIYVTGLSMGGYGSFDFAADYPGKIAAIAPLSGGENPALAERLKHMPAWIFHGDEDNVVPARYSVDLAHAMEKQGTPVKLTLYPGVGHGGWNVTYSDPHLYSWFLQYSK